MGLEKWDDAMSAVCVKEIDGMKVGKNYQIKGRGNLEFNYDPAVNGKTGYGLCLEEEIYENWNSPNYSDKFKWHYFTLSEMQEYFITDDEAYVIHRKQEMRDLKIENILYGNR